MPEQRATILVVDDDEAGRYATAQVLEAAGYATMQAATGRDALRMASRHPSLIILDVHMPDVSGYEVCRKVKTSPLTASIPILHLSAKRTTSEDRTRGLDCGGDAYLVQPVEPAELVATVRALLRGRQAEEAARNLAEEWQTTFDAISDGVCVVDKSGRIGRANHRVAGIFGQPAETLVGRNLHDVLPPEISRAIGHALLSVLETACRKTIELLIGNRWFKFNADPIVSGPTPGGIVCIFVDIHQRKQMELELKAARAAAEEASKAKDQFLAVLSHELRTPLTPVVAAVHMLQEGVEDELDAREALEVIHRNVEMEARLIDDLLDVTRIVRGKIELQRRPTMLGEVIRGALEVCRADIETRQIEFGMDIEPCASCLINADPTRLQQVFWNLLKNAVKFTPHGGCIGIRCTQEDGHVITEVVDSGEGIEPHLLPHIFNPFEQGGARVTRQFGGLGLGLTITKGVVEMHGGTIEAYSEGKGKGATFRVRLPICAACEAVSAQTPSGEVAAQDPATAVQKLRILLVEDHGDTAKVMHRLLSARGYEVEMAGDIATAIDCIEQEPFDLLLSDLGLPDGSGVDLMRRLREQGRDIPGIALSGFGQEEDVRRSREAGFAAHLIKPTNPDVLVRMIGAVVDGGRAM